MPTSRKLRISVTMNDETLKSIDEFAKFSRWDRAQIIREVTERYLPQFVVEERRRFAVEANMDAKDAKDAKVATLPQPTHTALEAPPKRSAVDQSYLEMLEEEKREKAKTKMAVQVKRKSETDLAWEAALNPTPSAKKPIAEKEGRKRVDISKQVAEIDETYLKQSRLDDIKRAEAIESTIGKEQDDDLFFDVSQYKKDETK